MATSSPKIFFNLAVMFDNSNLRNPQNLVGQNIRFLKALREVDLKGKVNYISQMGKIRNQDGHGNCWIYAGSDVLSWKLVDSGVDSQFQVGSAKRCTVLSDPTQRQQIRNSLVSKCKEIYHLCFGTLPIEYFEFILRHKLMKEDPEDSKDEGYSCVKEYDFANAPLREFPHLRATMSFNPTIEKLIEELQSGPVIGCLCVFKPDFFDLGKNEVYRGPTRIDSIYDGFHSMTIMEIKRVPNLKGDYDYVAVCRNSHGPDSHDGGYVSVCLKTRVIFYNVEKKGWDMDPIGLIPRITVLNSI